MSTKTLIVDDDPTNRKLLRVTLEAADIAVEEAEDGVAALAALRRAPFDVMITDILMPRMDGYRLCREVRRTPALQHLPIVAYTSTYLSRQDEELALRSGADCYLRKPAPVPELLAVLSELTRAGRVAGPLVPPLEDSAVTAEYTAVLVRKLEQKRTELSERNAELERANAELRASQARTERILESVSDAFVALDRDWRYTFVNARAAQILGRRREDLVGRHIWTEFPEGFGQSFHHAYEHAMRTGEFVQFEDYYAPLERWFENRIYPTPDGVSIFFHDITGRKRAEALLSAQNAVLEQIATGAPLAQSLTALVLAIEAQAPGVIGSILLLEADGETLRHGAAPHLPEAFVRAIDGVRIGSQVGSCGTAAHRGVAVMAEDIATDPLWAGYRDLALAHGLRACWSTPIFDAERRVLGTFAIYRREVGPVDAHCRDLMHSATHTAAIAITRARAESELRAGEERLRLAIDAGHMGTFDWDVPANRITWSRWHEELWGFAPGEFGGTYESFASRVHADDLSRVNAEVVRCRAQRAAFESEFRVVWPDGSLRWILARGRFAIDAGGSPARMHGVVLDITERKRDEAELRRAHDQLRALAARNEKLRESERTTMAREIHDVLAQELTRLKLDLVWVAKRAPVPADEATRAAVAARVADAIAQADSAISTVQRIATELRPVILDSLGLSAAVEWQVEDFAKRTGLECRALAPRGESSLTRDRATAIFRILQESLTNIARHAQAARVEVRLAEDDTGTTLAVWDDGCGITEAQIAEPRSIGLVGMRERVQAFGGTFVICGQPGVGTRVEARLPFAPAEDEAPAPAP